MLSWRFKSFWIDWGQNWKKKNCICDSIFYLSSTFTQKRLNDFKNLRKHSLYMCLFNKNVKKSIICNSFSQVDALQQFIPSQPIHQVNYLHKLRNSCNLPLEKMLYTKYVLESTTIIFFTPILYFLSISKLYKAYNIP